MKRLALIALFLLVTAPHAQAEITHITCGALGDRPCLVWEGGWLEGGLGADGCDRGLYADWIGYCKKRGGVIPVCISYRYPWKCANSDRTDQSDRLGDPRYTAQLLAQFELGRDEPLNWINLVGAHNAFNSDSDGYIKPNQEHSMTEQLDAGARILFLDVHQEATCNCLKLAHAEADGLGDAVFDRHLIYGLREIREWLRDNPGQFVVLRFEAFFDEGEADDPKLARESFAKMLGAELGPYLMPASAKERYPWNDRWPTLTEMRAHGWRAIAIGPANEWTQSGKYSNGIYVREFNKKVFDGTPLPMPTNHRFTHVEESALRTVLKSDTCTVDEDNTFSGGTGLICPFGESCEKGGRHSLFDWCPPERTVRLKDATDHGFSTISFDFWRGETYTESGALVSDDWPLHDLIWAGEYLNPEFPTNRDNLAAALSASTGRWYDADPGATMHYACSRLREGEPANWPDVTEGLGPRTVWGVTQATGPWEGGWQACIAEFGASGLVFSVPTNSWQNEDLKDLLPGLETDVWLAYRDTDPDAGPGQTDWNIDRGAGNSQLRSDPRISREGEPVRFESNWALDELQQCAPMGMLFEDFLASDTWSFGDDSAIGPSDGVKIGKDDVRFIRSHTFRDEKAPFNVTHSFENACENGTRHYGQVVFNVAPVLRVDCESWSSCPDDINRDEVVVRARENVALKASWSDDGADDVHASLVEWGDGNSDPAVVSRDADSTLAATGTLGASHAYDTCGNYRVEVSIIDIDGGRTVDHRSFQVEEAPPLITCPPAISAEADGPTGATVNTGTASVTGGYCGAVDVGSDAPSEFPFGATDVNWIARNSVASLDGEDGEYVYLEDTCTQNVTVADTTAPIVRAPNDALVAARDRAVEIGEAVASDVVGVVRIYNDAPIVFKPGTTVVTWYAVDAAGNVGTDTQSVNAYERNNGGGAIGILTLLALSFAALFVRRQRS